MKPLLRGASFLLRATALLNVTHSYKTVAKLLRRLLNNIMLMNFRQSLKETLFKELLLSFGLSLVTRSSLFVFRY